VVALVVMYYRFRTSRLTRDCRWRENRVEGRYVCAYCGATMPMENGPPNVCLRNRRGGAQ